MRKTRHQRREEFLNSWDKNTVGERRQDRRRKWREGWGK